MPVISNLISQKGPASTAIQRQYYFYSSG